MPKGLTFNPYRTCPRCEACGHHVIDMARHLQSKEHRQLSKQDRQPRPPFHLVDAGNGKKKKVLLP